VRLVFLARDSTMKVFGSKKISSEAMETTTGVEAATKPTRMERLRLAKKGKQKQVEESQPMWSFSGSEDKGDVKEHKSHSPGRIFKSRSKDSESRDEEVVVHARSESSSSSKLPAGKIFGDSRTQIKAVYNSFGETDVLHVEKEDDAPSIEGSNHVLIKVQVSTNQTQFAT